ncbi:MAG TPA: cytochrome c-550 PedF [Anaeromyxobacteraceae bacterium]|nr:cytochrome c-550 PedF [Anaeromyxobacteraceae bacterium]
MRIQKTWSWLVGGALLLFLVPAAVWPHGDVNPQPVDTTGLQPLGEAWRKTNPYRKNELAIKIGGSAYNQQCARCHGIGGVSGGLAPDLRYLPLGDEGDEAYLPPTRKGVFRNDRTLMPKYEGILSQEAMWAIRSWLETVHVD